MSDTQTHANFENPAVTMRDVMKEIGKHDTILVPGDLGLTTSHLITVPTHRHVQDLTDIHRKAMEYLKPARRNGTARLDDLRSFIDWTNRFKGETSALFANPDINAPTLTCVADYHAAGAATYDPETGDPTARHCHHRGVYQFPLSDEWKEWMAVSGTELEKEDLGEFIEAHAKDIMDPTPAVLAGKEDPQNADWENRLIGTARQIEGRYGQLTQLLAMSRQFQVHETSNLTAKTNRDTGESEVQFVNEHKAPDGKPLNIPNLIIIAIPVFMGGAPYRMSVRFRYRKVGGKVVFIMSIYNPKKSFDAAFDEAVTSARDETDLPTFLGRPEV